jgi:hypothetical protein
VLTVDIKTSYFDKRKKKNVGGTQAGERERNRDVSGMEECLQHKRQDVCASRSYASEDGTSRMYDDVWRHQMSNERACPHCSPHIYVGRRCRRSPRFRFLGYYLRSRYTRSRKSADIFRATILNSLSLSFSLFRFLLPLLSVTVTRQYIFTLHTHTHTQSHASIVCSFIIGTDVPQFRNVIIISA